MAKIELNPSIEEAREWYNSTNDVLHTLALKCFSKKELEEYTYTEICTIGDACRALNITKKIEDMSAIEIIEIITRALNKHYLPLKQEQEIYYPKITLLDSITISYNEDIYKDKVITNHYIIINNKHYYPIIEIVKAIGLSTDIGISGCVSEKIARHMSKCFYRELVDASYLHLYNYQWD